MRSNISSLFYTTTQRRMPFWMHSWLQTGHNPVVAIKYTKEGTILNTNTHIPSQYVHTHTHTHTHTHKCVYTHTRTHTMREMHTLKMQALVHVCISVLSNRSLPSCVYRPYVCVYVHTETATHCLLYCNGTRRNTMCVCVCV